MSPKVKTIESEIKKLPAEEQIALLGRLEDMVYGEADEDPGFIELIDRRVREIESGKVQGRNAFQVLDEIKARLEARHATS